MKDVIERLNRDIAAAEKARHEMIEKDTPGWPNAVLFLIESASSVRDCLTASEAAREKLEQTGASFLADVDCLCDWLNEQDISADHAESKPEDFDRLSDSMTAFRETLNTSEAHHG